MVPTANRPRPDSRRRSAETHDAILSAAAEMLETHAYADVTIEAIAKKARAGKQTIYRWWSSKAALYMEVYDTQLAKQERPIDTGAIEEDLRQLLRRMFRQYRTTVAAKALTGLIAEAQGDEVVLEQFRDEFIARRTQIARVLLQRALERNEISTATDIEMVIDMFSGVFWFRLLLKSGPMDNAYADRVIDGLRPMLK